MKNVLITCKTGKDERKWILGDLKKLVINDWTDCSSNQ